MASSAQSKALGWGIGIGVAVSAAIAYAVYLFYKLNEISQKVDDLADRMPRPKANPEDVAPIDITSTVVDTAPQSAIVTVAQTHSENVGHSGQNGSKPLENQALAICPEPQNESDHSAQSDSEWRHTEDFHTVTVNRRTFNLTLCQSRAMEKLWNARKNLIPELHQAAILEGIDSCSKRLRDVFKSNMEAYRALIARGERKGTFRLNLS